jgi:uracil-DNA glycosylase family 4
VGESLSVIEREVVQCERCPRLRAYCAEVARTRRRAFAEQSYWGRPVPGFGDRRARLLIVGLAPAAHGGNRTGRVFTGDRSGDFLYSALYRAGFANQPRSVARDDGLELRDCYVAAAVRCAPPQNRPLPAEFLNCRPYLVRELHSLRRVKVLLALGKVAHDQLLLALIEAGIELRRAAYPFSHGCEYTLPNGLRLFGSYHPSQQNTFTGKLTAAMLDRVLRRIRRRLDQQ